MGEMNRGFCDVAPKKVTTPCIAIVETKHVKSFHPMTRVNSANVLDEGLRIGEIGRRMNSKVKLVEIGVYRK
jgi:hypothetical protein